jgi:hypothetical protein
MHACCTRGLASPLLINPGLTVSSIWIDFTRAIAADETDPGIFTMLRINLFLQKEYGFAFSRFNNDKNSRQFLWRLDKFRTHLDNYLAFGIRHLAYGQIEFGRKNKFCLTISLVLFRQYLNEIRMVQSKFD